MKRLTLLFALLLLCAATSLAEGLAGKWKATAEGPNGTLERTFVFQVDGAKLTGETTSSMLGTSKIENGKIDGDSFSFTIKVNFNGEDASLNYKGKLKGNEITMTVEIMGNAIEWKGKRAD